MDCCGACGCLPEGERIPAIALTAYARPEDRARALAAGFRAHLSKPLDPGSLLREMSRGREERRLIAAYHPASAGGHCAVGDSLIPHSFILFSNVL